MSETHIARRLRRKATDPENRLWRILRGRRFAGYKFRRQHQVGPHNLDFYCAEARYNIELDGSGHGYPGKQASDKSRDEYLQSRNIHTWRFWNYQLGDVDWVRDIIWAELQQRAPHPENSQPEKPTRLPTRASAVIELQENEPR